MGPGAGGVDDRRADLLPDLQPGQQVVAGPLDRVEDPQGPVLGDGRSLEVGLHLMHEPVRARRRVHDDGQPPAVGPAPEVLHDSIGHVPVAPVVALGVPHRPAAQARHILGDPHRRPRPLGEGHHDLRQAGPVGQVLGVAEDPVDARREVHGGRTLADGRGERRGAESGISGSQRGIRSGAHHGPAGVGDVADQSGAGHRPDAVGGAQRDAPCPLHQPVLLGHREGDGLGGAGCAFTRKVFMRSPVLIPTGQASEHVPSPAQVWTAS